MKIFIKVCLSICSLIYLLSTMQLTPSLDYNIEEIDDYFFNVLNRVARPIEPIPELMAYRRIKYKGGYKRSPFDINNLSSQTKIVVSKSHIIKEVSLLVGDDSNDTFTPKDSYSIRNKYATEYEVLRNVIINRAFEEFKKKETKQNKSINKQYYVDILVVQNTQQIAVVFKTEITDLKKVTEPFKEVFSIKYSKKSTDIIFHELISELSDQLEINYNQVKKNSISNNLLTIMFPKKFNSFTKKSHKYGVGSKRTFSLRILASSSLERANKMKKNLLSKGYNSFIRVTRNRQPYKGYEGPIYLLLSGSFENKRAARSYKKELRLKYPNNYFFGVSKVVSTKQLLPPFEYTISPDIY